MLDSWNKVHNATNASYFLLAYFKLRQKFHKAPHAYSYGSTIARIAPPRMNKKKLSGI